MVVREYGEDLLSMRKDTVSAEAVEVALSGVAIALLLAEGKSADEINWLGNYIVEIGCVLLAIAAQDQCAKAASEQSGNSGSDVQQQIQAITKQVEAIANKLDKLTAAQ